LLSTSAFSQLSAILFGAIAGAWLCRHTGLIRAKHTPIKVSRRVGVAALASFFGLLFGLPLLRALTTSQAIAMMEAFTVPGRLCSGEGTSSCRCCGKPWLYPGGWATTPSWAGYGAAQAVPGPLFTFATYLGAVMEPAPNGLPGAALGLVTIFLPGLLLHLGTLPFWESFRRRPGDAGGHAWHQRRRRWATRRGTLLAHLTSAVQGPQDFAVALVGFILLVGWKAPPVVVVAVSALGGAAFALL